VWYALIVSESDEGCTGAPPRYVDPVVEALRKNVDKTLIRKNLKLTPEQRLLQLMELQRFAEELRRAGREARKR
jgi:hypothetical protein